MTIVVRASYIWLSGKDTYRDIRGKEKTLYLKEEELNQSDLTKLFPVWNFDGSSTGQATGLDTEIIIKPVRVFPFPITHPEFPSLKRFVVLCECYFPNGEPTPCNTRFLANKIFNSEVAKSLKPWFGMEQEYIIMKNERPLGWPERGYPAPQGNYYCGYGADRANGRNIIDRHYALGLAMGLKISGMNAEVMPGQWEFQVGPCEGIEAADHMIVARWLLLYITEEFSLQDGCIYTIDCEPKPVKGDWNGSGMHTNFSTVETRDSSGDQKGIQAMHRYLALLEQRVEAGIQVFGNHNDERLSGKHETSRIEQFTFGVGTRSTSIRIPNEVKKAGFGYFEDRRPGANADPYLVISYLTSTAVEAPRSS